MVKHLTSRARRFLKDKLSKKESTIFLAYGGAEPVGFAQLYPSFSSVSVKRLWILNGSFVSPRARGHGIATALLRRSEQLAERTRSKGLVLSTGRDNFEAQRLYERLGWKRDELFYNYSKDV